MVIKLINFWQKSKTYLKFIGRKMMPDEKSSICENDASKICKNSDKRFIHWYAILVTSISASYIFLTTFLTIPKDNMRIVDTVLGFVLGTLLSTIINFFFGSSSGSKNKDELIEKSIESR
jgi:hypothetical protein